MDSISTICDNWMTKGMKSWESGKYLAVDNPQRRSPAGGRFHLGSRRRRRKMERRLPWSLSQLETTARRDRWGRWSGSGATRRYTRSGTRACIRAGISSDRRPRTRPSRPGSRRTSPPGHPRASPCAGRAAGRPRPWDRGRRRVLTRFAFRAPAWRAGGVAA